MKIFSICFTFLTLILACKDPVPAPLPIPDPKLIVSKNLIELGDIKSSSKAYIKLKKDGIGTIKYTVTSSKSWLVLDNMDGSLGFFADTLKFHVDLLAKDLLEGDNMAVLTVKSSINDVTVPDYQVEIKGKYVPTTLQINTNSIALGTIKKPVSVQINLKKIGLENLSYDAVSDKPWVKLNKNNGNVSINDSLSINIDPSSLSAGSFEAKITVTPKVLSVLGKPSVVTISGNYDDTITGTIEGHTLTKNETWTGSISLKGTVIIPKGIVLTIKPGAIISVAKISNPISVTVFGKLSINGDISNRIEIKSMSNTPSTSDWTGIISNGEVEVSYLIIKNAKNAISFEFFSLVSSSSPPNIHHVMFDNCFLGIMNYQSISSSTLSDLTFRDIELFSIVFSNYKNTSVERCEFLNENGYIDLAILGNNGNLYIRNCNFMKKKLSYLSQLEVIDGYKFNTVTANNCYSLLTKNGFGVNGNTYNSTNDLFGQNLGIGCGFVSKYPQGRKGVK